MKKQRVIFVLALIGFFLISLKPASATDIKTDYDRAADFGRYKTYCWQKVETRNPLWIDRIKGAVGSTLNGKGWNQAESVSTCDVALVAIEIKKDHDTVNTFYDSFGGDFGGWGWRGFGGGDNFGQATTTTDTYQTGTLIIDIFDAKTKKLIWRGSATDTLSDQSGKNIKKLNNGVRKLFEHFPPQSRNTAKFHYGRFHRDGLATV